MLEDTLLAFEDTIDGYFPLAVSLSHMMDRLGAHDAVVELRFAPIFEVPGLAPTEPVPLRVTNGRIGQVDRMVLHVQQTTGIARLSGHGDWSWITAGTAGDIFDLSLIHI